MFEHVGPKNHRAYMEVAARCLASDGLFLLHFFATRRSWPNRLDSEVMWITKHIFPGIVAPSLAQVGRAVEGLFVLEDAENIGADYDPTLMAWHANFRAAWGRLAETYGERFFRMWEYYLLSCAGAFRARKYFVWQLVLSGQGVAGGYRRPRRGESVDVLVETFGGRPVFRGAQ
jgi:cyclopropane-fatty-acyl-phospholipid synthase